MTFVSRGVGVGDVLWGLGFGIWGSGFAGTSHDDNATLLEYFWQVAEGTFRFLDLVFPGVYLARCGKCTPPNFYTYLFTFAWV